MDPFEVPIAVLRLAEAAVFASPEPLTWQKLQPLLPRDLDPGVVFTALEKHCADRGVVLVKAGDGWTFRTAPDLGAQLREMMTETRRLPRVVMETLVLIALHQPITRAEIEEIRGVALAQSTMDILLESGLVKPWGRKEVSGRPTLWVTTPRFLSQFGLRSLRDLPSSHLTHSNVAKAGRPVAPGEAAAVDGAGAGRKSSIAGGRHDLEVREDHLEAKPMFLAGPGVYVLAGCLG